jgi:hypothetical protein
VDLYSFFYPNLTTPTTTPSPASQYQSLDGPVTTSTVFMVMQPTFTIPSAVGSPLILTDIRIWGRGVNGAASAPTIKVRAKNMSTGNEANYGSISGPGTDWGLYTFPAESYVTFTPSEINSGALAVKVFLSDDFTDVRRFDFYNPTTTLFATFTTTAPFFGQFTSEIATVTPINSWQNFNAENVTNGGSILYFIKASTSLVSIATVTYIPISPGSGINFPSQSNFIQWAATFTSIATPSSPRIDKVTITHNEGGVTDARPISEVWGNRYWAFGSTITSGNTSVGYLKSKVTNANPNAWMPVNGINIKSILVCDDLFYAGSSTAGVILRLDFGTNFNGSPIVAFYDTPLMTLGNNFFKKDLMKYLIDVEKETGSTLKIGTSVDGGAFTENSINTSGSGRMLTNLNAVNRNGYAFQFRFKNDTLDKDIGFNTFGVMYKTTQKGN